MAHVSGPCSTLPGSGHDVPPGTMCDDHPDRPAVARVQGETDSFGAEYIDMCQECLDEHRANKADPANSLGTCEWCGTKGVRVRPRRDYDEGMCGRVYDVCDDCVAKEIRPLVCQSLIERHWESYPRPGMGKVVYRPGDALPEVSVKGTDHEG